MSFLFFFWWCRGRLFPMPTLCLSATSVARGATGCLVEAASLRPFLRRACCLWIDHELLERTGIRLPDRLRKRAKRVVSR